MQIKVLLPACQNDDNVQAVMSLWHFSGHYQYFDFQNISISGILRRPILSVGIFFETGLLSDKNMFN
jgi:hypothetical protein